MNWIEVSISTTSAGVEHIESRLLLAGLSGWQVYDAEEMRSFLENNPRYWDYLDDNIFDDYPELVTVRFYAADDKPGRDLIAAVEAELDDLRRLPHDVDLGLLSITALPVKDEDWLDRWKDYFLPFEIGRNLVIKPSWEEYSNPDKIVVDINPGHVFGTGHHETTRMCIEVLERYIKAGDIMLDLGCGSGILSVIALLLGAEECVAADISPGAAGVTHLNAEANGLPKEKITVFIGDVVNDTQLHEQVNIHKYDCIAANIIADVIISLAPIVADMDCLKPGGWFLSSGIIKERLEEVVSSLVDAGFTVVETIIDGDWASVIVK